MRQSSSLLFPDRPAVADPRRTVVKMRMSNLLESPERWRARAAEARVLAESITDPDAKKAMIEIALSYEKLALRTEARRRGEPDLLSTPATGFTQSTWHHCAYAEWD